ncbi:MAG: hypothetical protein K2H47_08135 [Muribaculaceae bacterium]|nr:hypothetical protein [Muribaculaceae bacterium]
MKQSNILYLIIGWAIMGTSCSQSSNNAKITALVEDDRPTLESTDADRTFSIVLEIKSDSLMTCNNNFSGKDENPLILDTSNPDFPDLFSEWFASMDSIQINRLKNGSELHISVGTGVTDATIEKVKNNVIKCGIERMLYPIFKP